MISPLFFLVIFALLALTIAEITYEEGVMVLTDNNFDEATASHDQLLVEFYAPWCGHCKSLAPEWNKAAKTLEKSEFKLAKVDATENKALATQFEIRGFPTIKYFKGGKLVSDYNGGRTESDIVNFANKKTSPAAKNLASVEDLESFQDVNRVFVLGVFSSPDSVAAKNFIDMANVDESLTYAVSYSDSIREKLGVAGESIVILKEFDEKRHDHDVSTGFDRDLVSSFISGHTYPLIQEFSQEAAKTIFSSPITRHALFFTDKSADHHGQAMEVFSSVAPDYRGRVLFVNVPSTESRVVDYFGLTPADFPKLVLADMGESGLKKFPFMEALEKAALTEFFDSFFDGKLRPHLKSEEVSSEDTANPVVVVKGKSFKDLVLDNNKDVFVEFYAPWCGHCKNLAPMWEELAEKYADNENIVIAKMDATANEIDVPNVNVRGFPTLYFFKGNDKSNPIKYEDGRDVNSFVSFISKNAHHAHSNDEL